jgi:hypothetical protein
LATFYEIVNVNALVKTPAGAWRSPPDFARFAPGILYGFNVLILAQKNRSEGRRIGESMAEEPAWQKM